MENVKNLSDLISGDIGLSANDTWLSKTIRKAQSWWTGNALKSHAWMSVGDSLVVEALDKIRINRIKKYEPEIVDVYRLPLTDEERENLGLGMMRRVNGAYGWLKYPLFALDVVATKITGLFGKKKPVFFFTSIFGVSNIPVCSQLVVWGLYKFTSYRFRDEAHKEVNWKNMTPDYLDDLLQLPHNAAVKIYSSP